MTGNWGGGAFRGDVQLKFLIQWAACSLEDGIQRMVYCPWDMQASLLEAGLPELLELQEHLTVKKLLSILLDDNNGESYSKTGETTFQFVLEKLKTDEPRLQKKAKKDHDAQSDLGKVGQ